MTETGWQAIGRVAAARRERLGLKQDDLAFYDGPGVATVGKFERAQQASFPLRTQHRLERALGWSRGTIEQFVAAYSEGDLDMADWERDLIEESIPDLGRPSIPATEVDEPELASAVEALAGILRLVESDRLGEAVRDAVSAMLPYLAVKGATALGLSLRQSHESTRGGDGNADAPAGGSAPNQVPASGPAEQPDEDYLGLAAHEEEFTIEQEQEGNEFP